MGAQAGFYGVLFYVGDEHGEVSFVGDVPGFEASLPECADSVVFFVEVLCVALVDVFHDE